MPSHGGSDQDRVTVRARLQGKSIGASILARTLADRRVLLRKPMRAPTITPEGSAQWRVVDQTTRSTAGH